MNAEQVRAAKTLLVAGWSARAISRVMRLDHRELLDATLAMRVRMAEQARVRPPVDEAVEARKLRETRA